MIRRRGNCFSTGSVDGFHNTGGLVGYNERDSKIYGCYTTGMVRGKHGVGGFVGLNGKCEIDNCYATGNVVRAGGLLGEIDTIGKFISSYYVPNKGNFEKPSILKNGGFPKVKTKDPRKGIPKTIEELKDQLSFDGWDFTTVWGIDSSRNNGFPYLLQNPPRE